MQLGAARPNQTLCAQTWWLVSKSAAPRDGVTSMRGCTRNNRLITTGVRTTSRAFLQRMHFQAILQRHHLYMGSASLLRLMAVGRSHYSCSLKGACSNMHPAKLCSVGIITPGPPCTTQMVNWRDYCVRVDSNRTARSPRQTSSCLIHDDVNSL